MFDFTARFFFNHDAVDLYMYTGTLHVFCYHGMYVEHLAVTFNVKCFIRKFYCSY